jgi:hypothetical protein
VTRALAALLLCMLSLSAAAAGGPRADADAPGTPGSRVQHFSARAYEPGTRRPLYTERHRVELRNGRPWRETVTYAAANGEVFGRKSLEYRHSARAPSFRFEDLRTGRVEQVDRRGARWIVGLRERAGEELEQELLRTGPTVTVDEGYRAVLHDELARLRAGEATVADVIVASRLSRYDMRFRGHGVVRRRGEQLLHVRLDMDDLLLRLVGPSADLYVDPNTGRLREFVGLANIRDADGDLQQAQLFYRYE